MLSQHVVDIIEHIEIQIVSITPQNIDNRIEMIQALYIDRSMDQWQFIVTYLSIVSVWSVRCSYDACVDLSEYSWTAAAKRNGSLQRAKYSCLDKHAPRKRR